MSIERPLARRLAAACLAIAALLAVAAGPASALEPPRPLPGYRPAFVTETDQHPWRDCLWASAAMLLEKWTNGDVAKSHQQLRTLSRDAHGGSTFRDLHVAFARLGFRVPDNLAGDRLTWHQLLSRLRHGAGAVVLGDYHDLPRWYGRWDYGFWKAPRIKAHHDKKSSGGATAKPAGKPHHKAKVKRRADNHAVYVERYDARHHRVWLMDPLARGGWHGEWISVRALQSFAWSSGGRVYAVTTPTAAAAPFSGVRLTDPTVALSTGAITATWGLHAPRGWRWTGADVHVSMARASSALEAAARSALIAPRLSIDPAPPRPVAGVSGQQLRVAASLPTAPGAYTAAISLTDRRFGRGVVASTPVAVFVPGDQRATMRLNVLEDVLTAGGSLRVNLSVANGGDDTWAEPVRPRRDGPAAALGTGPERDTRVTAHWIRLDGAATTPGAAATAGSAPIGTAPADDAGPVTLLNVPLDPGDMARFRGDVAVPSAVGRWALVVDVEDSIVGSFATLGNAPAVALFDVVPPRRIEAAN
jgi:hypothetical protein